MKKLTTDFLRPFNSDQVAMLGVLAAEMEAYGLSAGDVAAMCREYNADLRARMLANPPPKPTNKLGQVCPECGAPVQISPVNVSRCTNVGGNWRTSLMCSKSACRYTELSVKTINDWRRG